MSASPKEREAASLVPVDEARRILVRFGLRPVQAVVPLRDASGHVLAMGVRADRDIPPFDRAAVDGYAVRLARAWEEGNEFRVAGVLPAGSRWEKKLLPGTAVKVMTGAPVPAGADGVVMVERSERSGEDRVRLHGPFDGRPGIAPRGQDTRRGEIVLRRGTLLGAPQIAVLASVGRTSIPVFRRPRVEILTTGAEVVQPERTPKPWQIRNANGPCLETLLEGACVLRSVSSAPDDFGALGKAIRRARTAEVLVLTGGVSAGDLDFVPDALSACGYRIRLHRLAIRPGKPLLFGTTGSGTSRRAVFGLPGNLVSVLVTAWEFLLPYLRAAAGRSDAGPARLRARAREAIERKSGLTHFVLGRWSADDAGLVVRAVPSNGSGDYLSAARANCLVPLSEEEPRVQAGEECWIHPWEVS